MDVHIHADHINPGSWRGNINVSQVVLQTCWKLGRLRIEEEFLSLANILHSITGSSFDMLSLLRKDLIMAPLDADDYDDTLDDTASKSTPN